MGWRKTTLTILATETESEELSLQDNAARRIKNLTFICPGTLPETVVIHVADEPGGTFKALNDGFGNDVVLLAGKSQIQTGISAGALKLVANGAVAADRVFLIRGAAQK